MWHLSPPDENDEVTKQQIEKLINQLTSLQVLYYRPTAMVPAMRLEVPGPAGHKRHQVGHAFTGG